MKNIYVLILFAMNVNILQAQGKFNLTANVNSGLYLADDKGSNTYYIGRGLQAGAGIMLNYLFFGKTKIGTGFGYNYVKTFEESYYSFEPVSPVLNTFEVPITVQQKFGKTSFTEIGVRSFFHTNKSNGKDGAFWGWHLGVGLIFQRLKLSINYSQNFRDNTLIIHSNNSQSVCFSEYKRKLVLIKLEYPIWKFEITDYVFLIRYFQFQVIPCFKVIISLKHFQFFRRVPKMFFKISYLVAIEFKAFVFQ